MKKTAYRCGICHASTTQPLVCDVCGAMLCPDCASRWVEGHAVVCEMCGDTLKAAAGVTPEGGLEEAT